MKLNRHLFPYLFLFLVAVMLIGWIIVRDWNIKTE